MQCASCKEYLVKDDTFATCCICLDHFHANEKRDEGSGPDCADVSVTEKRVLKLKTKILVYRCSECRKNGGSSPQLMEIIVDIKNTVEKLSSLNEKFGRLVNENLPKIKDRVKKLNAAHNATRATLVEATADIGELIERCSKFEDNLSSHINKCGDVSNLLNEEFSSASTIINEIEDRKKRENNLIILNVPEQIKNDKVKLTRDYDLKKVKLVLGKITNLDTRFNL